MIFWLIISFLIATYLQFVTYRVLLSQSLVMGYFDWLAYKILIDINEWIESFSDEQNHLPTKTDRKMLK